VKVWVVEVADEAGLLMWPKYRRSPR
jgi:hypothetical protein